MIKYADELLAKKQKTEKILITKLQARDALKKAFSHERMTEAQLVLMGDVDLLDIEIEALQDMIDHIDNELRKQGNIPEA